MEDDAGNGELSGRLETTAHIVAAYLEKNRIPSAQIAGLIASVSDALVRLSSPAAPESERLVPPVNPRKTVSADSIVSLEDSKPYKSLKRHLSTRGLTSDEYRRKWNLSADDPMVAPSYSAARSALALKLGLGRKPNPTKKTRKPRRASAAAKAAFVHDRAEG